MKDANSDDVQKEREIVMKLFKGKADEKRKVKLAYRDLYQIVEATWQLRTRHMEQAANSNADIEFDQPLSFKSYLNIVCYLW